MPSASPTETSAPTLTAVDPATTTVQRRTIELHGHAVSYYEAGPADAPVVLLLHGIACSATTWEPVLPLLAAHLHVIAPSLLGHGESAKPRGDYSLGAYASGVRDLLVALGYDSASVVGHSLGGGIAMQFAYQFPERCERLMLVSSGGLGRSVHPALRAVALPGAEFVVPMLCNQRVSAALGSAGRLLERLPAPLTAWIRPGAREIARSYTSLADTGARSAFVQTARGVIDAGGQRVNAADRLYLAEAMPMQLLWGARDPIIPVGHGRRAHELAPGSQLEVFESAGHFPHIDEPTRFAATLLGFIANTEAAHLDAASLRERLLAGQSG